MAALTRRILDDFTDETGLAVTATFAAYMLEHGFRTYREAQEDATAYALWSAERWSEFARERGIKSLLASPAERAAFIDWLDQRAHDHAARRDVEAA